MLGYPPYHPQAQACIYSQDSFLGAEYYESMARQASQEYAMAHARVQALASQRGQDVYRHYQALASQRGQDIYSHYQAPNHGFYPEATSWPASRYQPGPPTFFSVENLVPGARREQERRQNLLSFQHYNAQHQRALAEAAARQEAEWRARILQAQLLQEQKRREIERRFRAREAQRAQEEKAFLAFLSSMPQVATQVQARSQQSTLVTAPELEPAQRSFVIKCKGPVVEIPAVLTPTSVAALSQLAQQVPPTFQEELEARMRNETDPDVQQLLGLFYSNVFDAPDRSQPAFGGSSLPALKPVDHKGKGKAVEVPIETVPVSAPAPVHASQQVPTLREELEARIRTEADPDVLESLVLLFSDLFDIRHSDHAQPVAGPSKPKQTRFRVPVEEHIPSTPRSMETEATSQPVPDHPITRGAALDRTPALSRAVAAKLLKFYHARRARKLSLGEIQEVEGALRKLEETFEFPEHLDFVDPVPSDAGVESDSDESGRLAYTSKNTPVHAYENALNALLIRLDAVESNGDPKVRGRRKEVVKEVERALEVVERRVEESRERRASSPASVEAEVVPAAAVAEEVKLAAIEHTPEEQEDAPAALPSIETAPTVESIQSPLEVIEEGRSVSLGGEDILTDVIPSPSPSEYMLPPVSISESTTSDAQAPEATAPIPTTTTDDTAESASPAANTEPESPPALASDSSISSVVAEDTLCVCDPASEPMTRAASTVSFPAPSEDSDGAAFLLSSTPLADEPKKNLKSLRRASDELEIINKEEVEAVRNDSDWSDLESDA